MSGIVRSAAGQAASDSANTTIVWADAQPAVGAWTSPYTSANRAAVTDTTPAMSKLRVARVSRLSGNSPVARAVIATPTGTLIQNTHCQPGPSISGPPTIQAAVAAIPPVAPHAPIALLRSAPSGKLRIRIDKAAGVIAAAPRP